MDYECYGYHCADTYPVSDKLDIFGVELEIDDDNTAVREILNECIEDDILTVPYNEHRTRNWKVIENDSSVWKEIILNADTIPNLIDRIETLNFYGLNMENVINSRGTSCHIHINRAYLEKRGITPSNMLKLFEFYSPFIFAVSGRDLHRWTQWSEPITSTPLGLINWEQRGHEVSHVDFRTNRYHLVNTTRSSTIELRGFSNYYSFDSEMISFYLAFVKFAIDEAEKMKVKYYRQEWKMLRDDLFQFMEKYPAQRDHFKTDKLFIYSTEAAAMSAKFDEVGHTYRLMNQPHDFSFFADWLKYHSEYLPVIKYRLTLTPQGVKNAKQKVINCIYRELYSYMMAAYRSLATELKEVY